MKKIIIILGITITFIVLIVTLYFINRKVDIDNLYSSLVYIESKRDSIKVKGSGIVYDIKGNNSYIITNYHVIGNADEIIIYDKNKNSSIAEIVDYNELYDVALLKVKNLNLKKAQFGNSDKIDAFDEVYVFGNPLGYEYFGTISRGIVSYINRNIKVENLNNISEYRAIQVDASINSGNSGGALLNKNREVVGLITIKESDLDGVGFAIPINVVKEVIDNMNIK